MARQVTLWIDNDPPTIKDARFPFSGQELADATKLRSDRSERKMEAARIVFLAEIVKSAPTGITVDPDLIDIDHVDHDLRGGTSTMTYAQNIQLPMNEVCSKALGDYNRYKSEWQVFYRWYCLFARTPDILYSLSMDDAHLFRLFEPA